MYQAITILIYCTSAFVVVKTAERIVMLGRACRLLYSQWQED
ncbi:MAG TPA: hypothetical protein VGH91_04600 [Gammaproteobacteria bacterium]|jgi:hypothetical protein